MDATKPAPRTYPVGGDRDVRVRAVLGTHRLELGVELLEKGLRAITSVGRVLRLRFHQRDQRFEWRQRIRDSQGRTVAWRVVGARVPDEIRRTLWAETRSRVDGVEQWIAMRQDARSVLNLVDWLVAHGREWPAALLQVTWEGEGKIGRVHWTFRADGAIQETRNWQTPARPITAYGQATAAVVSGIDVARPRGTHAESVSRDLVERHAAIDARLRRLSELLREQHAGIRLYRVERKDTWCFREIAYAGGTRHLRAAVVGQRAATLTPQPQGNVGEAMQLLGERVQLRRLLRVIAELTEVAGFWPGGRWKLAARDAAGKALWQKTASRDGLLGRAYTRGRDGASCISGEGDEGEGAGAEEA